MKREALLRKNASAPILYITPEAYLKVQYLVDACSKEVGWFGSVKQDGDEYVIYDVYLFEQDVDATETDIDATSISKICNELMDEGKFDEVNELRFWGHSHVDMQVTPSGTDVSTAIEFGDPDKYPGVNYFIAGIFNKSRDMRFDFYDYVNREVWKELPIVIGDPAEFSKVKNLLDPQIKNLVYEVKYINYGHNAKSKHFQSKGAHNKNQQIINSYNGYWIDDWYYEDYDYNSGNGSNGQSHGVSTSQTGSTTTKSVGQRSDREPQHSQPTVPQPPAGGKESDSAERKPVGNQPPVPSAHTGYEPYDW